MIDIICALCGKKQQVKVLYPATFRQKDISKNIYSARRMPDRVHYQILKCLRCGLIFSSPILSPLKVAKLYRESICSYDEQVPYLTKTYLELLQRLKPAPGKRAKILEVGCGNGFFLKELKNQGLNNLYGVEPSWEMVSKIDKDIRSNIKIDIFKKSQFAVNYFDLICCFHTLDHMIDPNEFIAESFKLLKGGGIMLTVVHDTKGLSVKLFGERSPIFDIEHIYLFNKKTLRKIYLRHGFEIIDVFNVKNTYSFSYWFRMSGLSLFFKNVGQKILKLANFSKFPLSLAGGNICIIARKA